MPRQTIFRPLPSWENKPNVGYCSKTLCHRHPIRALIAFGISNVSQSSRDEDVLALGIHTVTGDARQIVQRAPVGVRSAESVCEYATSLFNSLK